MTISPYFNFYKSRPEQSLVEDLVNETLNIFGFNGYFIPREGDIDLIYGEDVLKKFTSSFIMAMRLESQIDTGMNQDFFSKFGLEIRNTIKLHVARREFLKQVPQDLYQRPREGDLVYIPHLSGTGELYEIKYVNDSPDKFSLGRKYPYYWELELELFKYSNEEISTGIDDIDVVNMVDAYSIEYQLNTGTGNYITSELVYQGITPTTNTCTGIVQNWDASNKILTLVNISGEFANSNTIIGMTSNAQYILAGYDPLNYDTTENAWDNYAIETEYSDLLDTSEINPFGTL